MTTAEGRVAPPRPSSIKPLRGPEPKRLGQLAADSLRHAILAGEFTAGTRLVEDDLAARLRISRGPVRDALRQLAEEGLVAMASRGAFVASPKLHDVWELYSLRCALECLSVELAVEQFTDDDLAVASQRLEALLAAARAGPLDVFVARDLGFHAVFYERSGHRRLLRSWQALEPSFRTLLTISNVNPRLNEVLRMHERILKAVKMRDAAAAQRCVRAHLAQAQPIIAAAYSRFQQAEPSRARR